MDQDANSGAPQDPQSTLNDPQTRRKFLRTAVIGAAGVAGGAAVAGVVLSRQSPGLLTGQFALTNNLISIHDGNCAVGGSDRAPRCSVFGEERLPNREPRRLW